MHQWEARWTRFSWMATFSRHPGLSVGFEPQTHTGDLHSWSSRVLRPFFNLARLVKIIFEAEFIDMHVFFWCLMGPESHSVRSHSWMEVPGNSLAVEDPNEARQETGVHDMNRLSKVSVTATFMTHARLLSAARAASKTPLPPSAATSNSGSTPPLSIWRLCSRGVTLRL